ncbi:MAG: GMC family oxidoreductase [Planctomycetota bacterium]
MIVEGRTLREQLELEADAVVVGTGAGGGMMLRELAARGLDVVGLEMGAHSTARDFTMREADMLELLMQERGARATADQQVRIVQGRGVGGSTVHNLCLCKRTPDLVLEHWVQAHAAERLSPASLAPSFAATEAELSVMKVDAGYLNENNRLFKVGCDVLGYASDYTAHNRIGCQKSGYCIMGCPFDGKQNALKVLLPKALEAGARIYSDAKVERILTQRGRAVGVSGTFLDAAGRPQGGFRVRARTVCLGGSAVGSAALCLQSGLPDPSGLTGRNLFVHPAGSVAGIFPQPVDGWRGVPQTYECTEFLEFHPGSEKRVWLVPVFAHPIATAVLTPGFGAAHAEVMAKYRHVAALTAVVHDESPGQVRVTPGGRIRIDYTLSPADQAQLALGLKEGARILLAAGAKQVLVNYENDPIVLTDPSGLERITARGAPPYELPLTAVHPMSTLPMSDDPRRGVVDSRGEHHAVGGLFVCDGSVFPTSIGVPPQISIYSVSRHVARFVAEACGGR